MEQESLGPGFWQNNDAAQQVMRRIARLQQSITPWRKLEQRVSEALELAELMDLEEEKDPATLTCIADSNPPATVLWRKEGLDGIFSPDREITFSPVTRHTAGLYSCTAENALGLSKPQFVELDVKCKFS